MCYGREVRMPYLPKGSTPHPHSTVHVHITIIATNVAPLSGKGTFPCDQTQCNNFLQTTAAANIVNPAVKDTVKFKYACVGELWCIVSNVPATKSTSERL